MNIVRKASKPGTKDYDFSSIHVVLPTELADALLDWGKKHITPDMLEGEDCKLEDYPHITCKYGVHSEEPAEVQELLVDEKAVQFRLGKVSLFKSEDESPDVVKVEIESPDLHRINKKISDNIECTDTFPKYVPHATIAYVKKGSANSLDGNTDLQGLQGKVDELEFSSKKKEKGATDLKLVCKTGVYTPATTHGSGPEQEIDERKFWLPDGGVIQLPAYLLRLKDSENPRDQLWVEISPVQTLVDEPRDRWEVQQPISYRLQVSCYLSGRRRDLMTKLESAGFTTHQLVVATKDFATFDQAKAELPQLFSVISSVEKSASYQPWGSAAEDVYSRNHKLEDGTSQNLQEYLLQLENPKEYQDQIKVRIEPTLVRKGNQWRVQVPVTYHLTVSYQYAEVGPQLMNSLKAAGFTTDEKFADDWFPTFEQAKQGVSTVLDALEALEATDKTASFSPVKESESGEMFTDEEEFLGLFTTETSDTRRLPTYRIILTDNPKFRTMGPGDYDNSCVDIVVSPTLAGNHLVVPVTYTVYVASPPRLTHLEAYFKTAGFRGRDPWNTLQVPTFEAGKQVVGKIIEILNPEGKTAAFTPSLVNAPTNRGNDSDSDVVIPTKPEFTDSEENWHFPYVKRNVDWDMVLPTIMELNSALKPDLPELPRPPKGLEDLLVWFKRYTDHSDGAIADMSEAQAYAIALRLWGTWKARDTQANQLTYLELQGGPKELALGLGLAVLPTPSDAKSPAPADHPKSPMSTPHKKEHPKKHKHPVGWKHYEHLVGMAADQFKVPPQMLHRLFRAENPWGDPNAVSEAGAIGLAQFMPGTAAELGIDPKDPKASIDGAARYLSKLYHQFGNWVDAVRAYNWGPGHVRKHQKEPERDPEETRRYVHKILPRQGGKQPNTTWKSDEPFSPLTTMLPLETNDDNLTQQYSRNFKALKDSPYWDNLGLIFEFMADSSIKQGTFRLASAGADFLIVQAVPRCGSLGKKASFKRWETKRNNTYKTVDGGVQDTESYYLVLASHESEVGPTPAVDISVQPRLVSVAGGIFQPITSYYTRIEAQWALKEILVPLGFKSSGYKVHTKEYPSFQQAMDDLQNVLPPLDEHLDELADQLHYRQLTRVKRDLDQVTQIHKRRMDKADRATRNYVEEFPIADSNLAPNLTKTAATYDDKEMEEITNKVREDSGDHYGDDPGGGNTMHTWNDDSNDYPQPKDMQKGTPLDQLVPVDRRFQQHITPPTSSPVDFIKEPTSDGDMGDYDYSKWKKSSSLTPLELTAANLIGLSQVQVLDVSEDFSEVKGSANFLGKAVLWSAKLVPTAGKIRMYKIDASEIEKVIRRAKLTAQTRREQFDMVLEKIRELLYAPKTVTHRQVPSAEEITQLWDSIPTLWWTKKDPQTTTLTLEYVQDLLRRHKFDANYFSVFPTGRSQKYSWTLAGGAMLLTKY